jgi:hypothetical protein
MKGGNCIGRYLCDSTIFWCLIPGVYAHVLGLANQSISSERYGSLNVQHTHLFLLPVSRLDLMIKTSTWFLCIQ